MRWRRSAMARSTAFAISIWPGRYSYGSGEPARMPPGAKNSCRVGRVRIEVSVEGIGTAALSIIVRRAIPNLVPNLPGATVDTGATADNGIRVSPIAKRGGSGASFAKLPQIGHPGAVG